jgi:predicted nucleic acid-binding protein
VDFLFLDTSGLLKGYANETGSAWVRGLLLPETGNKAVISVLTKVEVVAAIRRRERNGSLASYAAALAISLFRYHLENHYFIAPLETEAVELAMNLADLHVLRGYDAMQLATALLIHRQRVSLGLSPVVFVSADEGLNAVATLEGLAVEDPNQH